MNKTLIALALIALSFNAAAGTWEQCRDQFNADSEVLNGYKSVGDVCGESIEKIIADMEKTASEITASVKEGLLDVVARECGDYSGDLDEALKLEKKMGGKRWLQYFSEKVSREEAQAACRKGWVEAEPRRRAIAEEKARKAIKLDIGSPEENITKKLGPPRNLSTVRTAQGTTRAYVYGGLAVHTVNGRVTKISTYR